MFCVVCLILFGRSRRWIENVVRCIMHEYGGGKLNLELRKGLGGDFGVATLKLNTNFDVFVTIYA